MAFALRESLKWSAIGCRSIVASVEWRNRHIKDKLKFSLLISERVQYVFEF